MKPVVTKAKTLEEKKAKALQDNKNITNAFKKMTTTKAMLGVVKRLHEGQAKDKDEASLAQKKQQNDPLLHKPDKWTNKKGPKRTMKPAKPPPNLKQLEMQ